MDIKEKILKTLYSIEKRPGMYMADHTNYAKFSAYIEGFLLGAGLVDGQHDYSPKALTHHFTRRHGKEQSSMVLSSLIDYTYSTTCDEEKYCAYLQAVIDYFENQ